MRAYHERSPRTGTVFQCEHCKKFFDAEKTSPEDVAKHEASCHEEVKEQRRVDRLNDYTMQVITGEEEGWLPSETDDGMVDSYVETITFEPKAPATPEDLKQIIVVERMSGTQNIVVLRKP